MVSWAIVVVLYLFGMGFFYLIGGVAGAATPSPAGATEALRCTAANLQPVADRPAPART